MNLRPEVEVQPNDGFGVLLPLEEKDVKVFFKPISAIYHDFNLTVQTTMNMKSNIRLRCQGLETPLKLTNTVLKFASCCPGDRISHSIFATNTTSTEQTFEFVAPHANKSYLSISPNVETLLPGESCRLEIEFMPPMMSTEAPAAVVAAEPVEGEEEEEEKEVVEEEEEDVEEEKKMETTPRDSPIVNYCEGEQNESHWNTSTNDNFDEPWSVHSRWSLPCFIKGNSVPLFVDVNTTLVKRILDIATDSLSFGQLAVGQVKVLVLRVRNLGSVEAPIFAEGLNSTGAFSIVNALRTIQPNSIQTLSLQFAPQAQGVRAETLVLRCPKVSE